MKTYIKPALVVLACGMMAGCASGMRSELDEVKAMAEQAAADAAEAKQQAAAAQSSADAAMDTAQSAKSQSDETADKIDRMFKKAMYK